MEMLNCILRNDNNRYDWYIILIIASIAFGQIGGAFQIMRIISLLLLPVNIWSVITKRYAKISIYFVFAIFWLLYGSIALLWAPDVVNGRYELLYVLLQLNIIYSLVKFSKQTNNPIKSIIMGWCGFLLLTLPIASWKLITNNHFYTNELQSSRMDEGLLINGIIDKKYAAATFGNYNEYITAISFMLPYLFLGILILRRKKQRQLLLLQLLLVSLVILFNASRGGIICLFINVSCFLFYCLRYYRRNRFLIYLLFLASVILLFEYKDIVLSQIFERSNTVTGMLEDKGRIMLYIQALELLSDSYYAGVGPFGFQAIVGFAPHNMWLEILVQYGVLVFIFFIFVLSILLFSLYKLTKGTVFSFIPISVTLTLSFVSVINSGYLFFPFWGGAIASLAVIYSSVYRYSTI